MFQSNSAVFDTLNELKDSDPEFQSVEYLIQMHLGSINLKIARLYSVRELQGNQQLQKSFKAFARESKASVVATRY